MTKNETLLIKAKEYLEEKHNDFFNQNVFYFSYGKFCFHNKRHGPEKEWTLVENAFNEKNLKKELDEIVLYVKHFYEQKKYML